MLKLSYLIAALAAVLLLGAGFAVGLASAGGDRGIIPLSNEDQIETSREETTEAEPPAPRTVVIPDEDVPGADLDGLSRYPGAVRIEYLRERQGDVIWTEIEYLTNASMSEAREHYRNAFRESDWNVNDIGFTQNSWVFFVVKGEREVFVELQPRGDSVEIDLEQTEPVPQEPKPQQTQPAPQQPAPEQVVPVQPPPVYDDDDYYDDDVYEDDYDDDYGDYDD